MYSYLIWLLFNINARKHSCNNEDDIEQKPIKFAACQRRNGDGRRNLSSIGISTLLRSLETDQLNIANPDATEAGVNEGDSVGANKGIGTGNFNKV